MLTVLEADVQVKIGIDAPSELSIVRTGLVD
ncbi:MAG: carbon storage regulator [Gammaproteobacteria bacterium]|nr:carbon storage regulator [Gammaproteobacteria bacterium]